MNDHINRIANDEEFVRELNRMINEPNPIGRISLIMELSMGFGRLAMCPTPALEQLITKIQHEHDEIKKGGVSALPPEIVEFSLKRARRAIDTLNVFLKNREAIVADFRKAMPDTSFPE